MVPVFCLKGSARTGVFREYDIGDLGPDKGFGIRIVLAEIVMDCSLQLGHAGEDASVNTLAGDLGEEALDQVQPRGRRRNKLIDDQQLLFRERVLQAHKALLIARLGELVDLKNDDASIRPQNASHAAVLSHPRDRRTQAETVWQNIDSFDVAA